MINNELQQFKLFLIFIRFVIQKKQLRTIEELTAFLTETEHIIDSKIASEISLIFSI